MRSQYATDYATVSQTRRHISEVRLPSATTRPAPRFCASSPYLFAASRVMGLIIYVHSSSGFVDYSWKRGVVGSFGCLSPALGHDHLNMAWMLCRVTNLQHGLNIGVTYTGSAMRFGWCLPADSWCALAGAGTSIDIEIDC